MKFISPRDFTADTAWDALPIANMNGITTRLHWTDKPYKWHVNDGEEVFVVLDGCVDMHYRDADGEHVQRMNVGDIFHASVGTEHVAHPVGEVRVLVVESEGSV
jgi:mannose-6-phosphate isomerase-like protein (cupin superfamily)